MKEYLFIVLFITLQCFLPVHGLAASSKSKFDWVEFYFDDSPNTPYTVYKNFYAGAEIESDVEGEFNFNLDREDDEDEVEIDTNLQLNLLYDNSEKLRGYLELEVSHRHFFVTPSSNQPELNFKVKEANVSILNSERSAGITIGRMNISDERSWLFDTDLDGIQLAWKSETTAIEFLFAREDLLRINPFAEYGESEPNYYHLRLYSRPNESILTSIYGIHQQSSTSTETDLTWIGTSATGNIDSSFDFWLDSAFVLGTEDGRKVEGYGFDLGFTREFEDHNFRPRLTAAIAFGSGDDGQGTDNAFRQTGLQSNNDRFGGRKSFRYYGEVLDPELSNLQILTIGGGVHLSEKATLDVIYHRYYQHFASDEIRDSNLDADPSGNSRHLGDEFDIVVGFRELEKIDLDLIFGVFLPGSAFEDNNDPAYFSGLEFKFTF